MTRCVVTAIPRSVRRTRVHTTMTETPSTARIVAIHEGGDQSAALPRTAAAATNAATHSMNTSKKPKANCSFAIFFLAPRRQAPRNMHEARSAIHHVAITPGEGEGPAALGGVRKRTL